jgi:hypothetical protein
MAKSMAVLLQIQDDGVLFGLIRYQILIIPCIFFQNALKASLDARCFVQDDVVSHTPTRSR